MNRAVPVLLLVLLIQCGIVAIVFWPQQSPGTGATGPGLAPFSVDAIDELRIGDEFDNEAILVKSGQQWLLPDLENLPADPAKVDTLLQSITGQAGSWPIARTPSRAIGPASACSAWRSATGRPASMPRAPAPWPRARAPIATSTRS